jgi:tungstate transport system ATP-binding protein
MEALRLSDRIAVIQQGRSPRGFSEEVMNHPVNEFVAAFVGMDTLLTGSVLESQNGRIMIAVGNQKIEAVGNFPVGEQVLCCIRPENVTLSTDSPEEQSSARNNFSGRITRIAPHGLFYALIWTVVLISFPTLPAHPLTVWNFRRVKPSRPPSRLPPFM